MKLPKKQRKSGNLLATVLTIFVVVFALAVVGKIYIAFNQKAVKEATTDLAYTLSPDKTDLEAGDKVLIPLYLSGDDADSVTAFDIKFDYDKTKLQLTGATPGAFFEKYLTVKWDDKEAWYALAMTPSTPQKNSDPMSPLLTLEFTALTNATSTSVSTNTSTVYVSKTGGFHPQNGRAVFKIQ